MSKIFKYKSIFLKEISEINQFALRLGKISFNGWRLDQYSEKKRYVHYINNRLHVFHVPVPQVLSKEAEQVELKRKEANDMIELERIAKETEAKKQSAEIFTFDKKLKKFH